MKLRTRRADWELATPLHITARSFAQAYTVVVELTDGRFMGRGECNGAYYRGETQATMEAEIERARPQIEKGIDRSALRQLMPAGGARNAVDAALWDLEAKRAGTRAWTLAGLTEIRPLVTAFTVGVDTPEKMGAAAAAAATRKLDVLKLKLTGDDDLARVAAVRAGHPHARIIVDANQGWSERHLREFPRELARLGVELIEQPLRAGADDLLEGFESPVPFCADESCQTLLSVPALVGKYQFVNIKLDKCGGLTEALLLAQDARARGLRLMVGCMLGSSLGMAPAFIVGQRCEFVDLDAPLLQVNDIEHGIRYDGNVMAPPEPRLWG
ncbi:MAG: N-acetyl-D-Glu racemase DgcA [Gammaproteobacteria bacterium]